MKKMMLVGSTGAGKTTLMQRLHDDKIGYHKTQYVYDEGDIIDTPGEYLDLGHFKYVLQLHSATADVIAFLQAAHDERLRLPPGFNSYFTKPVIGVISQIDAATPEQIERTRQVLQLAGVAKIFEISALTGQGIDDLVDYLAQ